MTPIILFLLAAAADQSTTNLRRDAVLEFAICVDRYSRENAMRFISSEPGSDSERSLGGTLAGANSTCLKDKDGISFPPALLRGQLAELAFQRDPALLGKARTLLVEAPIMPDMAMIDKKAGKSRNFQEYSVIENFRKEYARCIVHSSPTGVATIAGTKPASAEERSALLDAGPTLMACTPPGISYHIIPAELRPYLMSELYYRIVSSKTPGA